MRTETIAAVATAMSNAGISIVRISGSEAIDIISKIFKPKNKDKDIKKANSHTIHYGYIIDGSITIDEVLVLIMKGPNSYTREDIVEIDCHGGVTVTKRILETVLKYGARAAEPGEFTKRAFLNGRIDLSQAEAVIDIINSKNEYALNNAMNQLKGNILTKVKDIRENILHDIAYIEAALDDPEHISLEYFSEELLIHINDNQKELRRLLDSADNGRILKEGIKTVILGKPNAGKSSLLNILVGDERAIVTDIAGTTRDTLEESININGISLNIVDTAGIRDTEDVVEKIGVDKAKSFANFADLIIYVVDGSTTLDKNDREIIEMIKDKKAIILLNKTDLDIITREEDLRKYLTQPIVLISAKENKGIDILENLLKDMFFNGEISFNDEVYITNIRHKEALKESINSLEQVEKSIEDNMPEDFYSIDLMNAYEELGHIIGESVEDDLVNKIFHEFCMGK
ncbi:tRNA modification GTPase [Mobilisporobacter senegalensis]|uniref:tRNA modification GTPase MnmE n=1 Tax=Mobilisporobacter senegalensis TaxID=1329262 RepID=A0A3N1X5U9_9FIRM|nr:tRNA uridine-5-carboxymethylaminomethyl(34) synthesis GTPase MnmE [Mobilisporobacter senegalensis]ROR22135.1 tRNA modification GTPase [Mobilisporobacter senegalensis]